VSQGLEIDTSTHTERQGQCPETNKDIEGILETHRQQLEKATFTRLLREFRQLPLPTKTDDASVKTEFLSGLCDIQNCYNQQFLAPLCKLSELFGWRNNVPDSKILDRPAPCRDLSRIYSLSDLLLKLCAKHEEQTAPLLFKFSFSRPSKERDCTAISQNAKSDIEAELSSFHDNWIHLDAVHYDLQKIWEFVVADYMG